MWWGIVTLTTVGYGDIYPVTFEGRVAAGVLMVLGISLFAGITATITSFLITRGEEMPSPTASSDLERQLHELIILRGDGIIDEAGFETGVRRVGEKIAERREADRFRPRPIDPPASAGN